MPAKAGGGKSTFINGILGKIDGIEFKEGRIKKDQYIEFYQSIKEKMPTSNITLNELFELDNYDKLNELELILECFKICKIDDWFNKDIRSFETEIKEKISGGQKIRLALVTRLFKLLKNKNINILILDEPAFAGKGQSKVVINILHQKF